MSRTLLRVESLERRDTPAVFPTFSAGQLHIGFDNEAAPNANPYSAQATTISSYEGYVTITEAGYETKIYDEYHRPVLAADVEEIVVDGSNQPNFIDLHLVDVGQGFSSNLNGRISLFGHGGNDVLIGSQFDDRIRGGDGFDQIYAGSGDDWIAGDAGDDWLYGGYGNNVYQGGSGRDWFDRFHLGDRVVDFVPNYDFYDPIGVLPQKIGMDKALRYRLIEADWNLQDEPPTRKAATDSGAEMIYLGGRDTLAPK